MALRPDEIDDKPKRENPSSTQAAAPTSSGGIRLEMPNGLSPNQQTAFRMNGEVRPEEIAALEAREINRRKVDDFLQAVGDMSSAAYYTKPTWEKRNEWIRGETPDALWLNTMKEVPLGNYEETDIRFLHLMSSALLDIYQQMIPADSFTWGHVLDLEQMREFFHIQHTRGRGFSERKAHVTSITEHKGEQREFIKTPQAGRGVLSRVRGLMPGGRKEEEGFE